jgi:hypothetical protein
MSVLRRIPLGPLAARPAFEQVAVAQQAVERSGDRGAVAEQCSPSSTGRLKVNSVLARSWRRMTISSISSAVALSSAAARRTNRRGLPVILGRHYVALSSRVFGERTAAHAGLRFVQTHLPEKSDRVKTACAVAYPVPILHGPSELSAAACLAIHEVHRLWILENHCTACSAWWSCVRRLCPT